MNSQNRNTHTSRMSSWLRKEDGGNRQGVWEGPGHTAIIKVNNKQHNIQ